MAQTHAPAPSPVPAIQAPPAPEGFWARHPEAFTALGVSAFFLLLALVLLLRRLPSHLRARKRPTLDPEQLEEMMLGSPPRILDLRPAEAYRGPKGHIRGAENLPFPELLRSLDAFSVTHPRPIVLVDETDVLSHQAAPLLAERGQAWLYVLKGGMRAWRRARLPIYVFDPR